MISRQGLSRLIAIHCGKYDYANIETASSLHLVGPNNVGKTSLISLLQFLYIDDQRKMHFSRDSAQTRRYYFPDPYSYVIFECMTPTGIQCLGVHGLGPLKMNEYERFAWTGKFEEKDFLDENRRPLPYEKVKEKLALKGFAELEPRHLRAALTSIGDNKGINLGLVPLRHRDYYERFRSAFCNLLRLAHLKQEELKELLLEIYDSEFQVRTIDLERGYAAQYSNVKRDAQNLQQLKALAPDITKLLAHVTARDIWRKRLPVLWEAIGIGYENEKSRLETESADISTQLEKLDEQNLVIRSGIEKAQERRVTAASAKNKLADVLADLEQEKTSFADFVLECKQARQQTLKDEIELLAFQLRDASEDTQERVQARIDRTTRELSGLRTQLANAENNVAVQLKGKIGTEKMEAVFKILNPALLSLPLGADGIAVADENIALNELDRIHDKIKAGSFETAGARINIAKIPPHEFGVYTSPELLRVEIENHERQLNKDTLVLEAIAKTDELKQQKAVKQAELSALDRELLAFDAFRNKLVNEPQWREQFAALEIEETHARVEENKLESAKEELRFTHEKLKRRAEETDRKRQSLLKQRQALPSLPDEWRATQPLTSVPDEQADFDTLLTTYRDGFAKEERENDLAQDYFARIEKSTYSSLKGATEQETVETLRQQLDALPEKEKLAQQAWTSLAVSMKNAFKGLARDMETLKAKVTELNRKLGQVDISNLDKVRLNVEPRREWQERLQAIIMADDTPLFADIAGADKALEELGALLGKYPQVKLQDMFDLHFEVTHPGGESRTYPDLDKIESNGTTITIKVLVNLLLLRGLLDSDKVVLPFYLDEASSLDRANLLAIMTTADSLGFVPVLASPDALDAAEYVYFVREANGRVALDNKSRIRCRRTELEVAAP